MRRVANASAKLVLSIALVALVGFAEAPSAEIPAPARVVSSDNMDSAEKVLTYFELLTAVESGRPGTAGDIFLRGSGLDAATTTRLVEHAKSVSNELIDLQEASRAHTCLKRAQLQTRSALDQQMQQEEAWVAAERAKKADLSSVLTVDQQALFLRHLERGGVSIQGLGSLERVMEGKEAKEVLSFLCDVPPPGSGATSPTSGERMTDEQALYSILHMSRTLDAEMFAKVARISRPGAEVVVAHAKSIEAAQRQDAYDDWSLICSKRDQLRTGKAFDQALHELNVQNVQRWRDRVRALFPKLSAADGANLRTFVEQYRAGSVGFGTGDPASRSDTDAAKMTDSMCRQQPSLEDVT